MDGFSPAVPVPKVVVDRYRKHLREEDINRGTANYAKAAAAGAVAGLVARFKKAQLGHRALVGAGAGLVAEGLVRAAGRATKDPYGERSHTAKVSEKLPIAAGAATAGVLAYKRVKRALKDFGANAQRPTPNAQCRITEFSISASLRRKLITAVALSGGITVADAATRASFPDDDETRKKAALKGLKEGAVYGGVLAGTEPLLRKIAMKFHDRRRLTQFRALAPTRNSAIDSEDLAGQRRKLALYAGGALAGAGALALLARSGAGRVVTPAAGVVKPAGRGTLDRLAAANKLRSERGYVHMKPMAPGQRKRFDKLPAQTQVDAGKVARLAVHPQLSPGERQKMRQWMGRLRSAHKFSVRQNLQNFQNPGNHSVDSVHSVKNLERRLRNAVEFMYAEGGGVPQGTGYSGMGGQTNAVKIPKKKKRPVKTISKVAVVERKLRKKVSGLERRLCNAVEFMYAEGGDLPEWVQGRRKNQNRRDRLHTAAQVAGVAGGATTVAAALHGILARKKAVKTLKDYLKGVGLTDTRAVTFFKKREQLREGGKAEAEKGSGRFAGPLRVAAGLTPAYSIAPSGEKRFYGGAHGEDLPIAHAQVLRSAYAHGGTIRKYAKRAGSLLRDTADVAVGNPRRADAYGRPQRREWEKPWFGRAVKDVAIGGGLLGLTLASKKSPRLRAAAMKLHENLRTKVNSIFPDTFADWGPGVSVTSFASVPFKFSGKIDYRRQNAMYDWAKQLRRAVRRKAGLPIRPPIAGSIPAKPSSVVRGFSGRVRNAQRRMIHFDDVANWAGWDVRDPRGRSARVFAPGSRKRMRREKDWHERVDVQRKLLGALALVGTVGAGTAGLLIGRHHPITPRPKIGNIVKGPWTKVKA